MSNTYCPVCGAYGEGFLPLPLAARQRGIKYGFVYAGKCEMTPYDTYLCKKCRSTDRERLYTFYLTQEIKSNNFSGVHKAIHFAPEPRFSKYIQQSKIFEVYHTADFMMKNVDYKVDLMNLQFPNESYDFFICSHVLEHVPDDLKAIRELHRITSKNGFGILMAPIAVDLQKTIEDSNAKSIGQRIHLYGQGDHLRLYAHAEYVQRISSNGFNVHEYGQDYFGMETFSQLGLKPTSVLYIASKENIKLYKPSENQGQELSNNSEISGDNEKKENQFMIMDKWALIKLIANNESTSLSVKISGDNVDFKFIK